MLLVEALSRMFNWVVVAADVSDIPAIIAVSAVFASMSELGAQLADVSNGDKSVTILMPEKFRNTLNCWFINYVIGLGNRIES